MVVSVLFLISCIITARFFEKQKMRVASVLYSVLFIVILAMLMATLDFPITDIALTNILGRKTYIDLKRVLLEIINMNYYGVGMITVIGFSIASQIAFIVVHATKSVVRCFIKRKQERKFKKAYFKPARLVRRLYLPKRINLLYCRMLN